MKIRNLAAALASAFLCQGASADTTAPQVTDADDAAIENIQVDELNADQLAEEYPYLEALMDGETINTETLDANADPSSESFTAMGRRGGGRGMYRYRGGNRWHGNRWHGNRWHGGNRYWRGGRWWYRDRVWRGGRWIWWDRPWVGVGVGPVVIGTRACFARNGNGVVFRAVGAFSTWSLQRAAVRRCMRNSRFPATCRAIGCR